jgi:hypothetical protein
MKVHARQLMMPCFTSRNQGRKLTVIGLTFACPVAMLSFHPELTKVKIHVAFFCNSSLILDL